MNVRMRLVTMDDADLLLKWRNDPVAVVQSYSISEVSHDEHIKWLESRLNSDKSMILIGSIGEEGEPIGMVRLDETREQIWHVSINLAPEHRGKCLSSALLKAAIQFFSHLHTAVLVASVKSDNMPSRKCFEASGFGRYVETDTHLTYINKELIINEIERVRQRNNVNWMNLMRLAFRVAPLEAEEIFKNVNKDDGVIADLLHMLTQKIAE